MWQVIVSIKGSDHTHLYRTKPQHSDLLAGFCAHFFLGFLVATEPEMPLIRWQPLGSKQKGASRSATPKHSLLANGNVSAVSHSNRTRCEHVSMATSVKPRRCPEAMNKSQQRQAQGFFTRLSMFIFSSSQQLMLSAGKKPLQGQASL